MKKFVSMLVICTMLACAVLEIAVSAAGDVLWKEDFSSADPNNWLWDDSAFFVEEGECRGWSEAVVHQSNFPTATGGTRKYGQSALKIECVAYDDGGKDSEEHSLGLWWADYFDPYATDEPESWIIYKPIYNFESHSIELEMEFTGDDAQPYCPADFPEDSVVFREEISDDIAPEFGGDRFTLGYRVNAGVFSIFINDHKVVDFPCYRGATTGTQRPSPVILLNGGCYCGFDNLVVATPDYDLFNEGAAQNAPADNTPTDNAPADGAAANDGSAPANDGAENGAANDAPAGNTPANTGATPTGGTAARTGDAAIVVIAVMIAALGCAIAVRKLGSR